MIGIGWVGELAPQLGHERPQLIGQRERGSHVRFLLVSQSVGARLGHAGRFAAVRTIPTATVDR